MLNGSAACWLKYLLGLRLADTQVTQAERACLARYGAGKRNMVEIGVLHGVTTSLLRSVMDPEGSITGIPKKLSLLTYGFGRSTLCIA